MLWRKIKQGRRQNKECWEARVRVCLLKKVILSKNLKQQKSHIGIWRKSPAGRKGSRCKGPEVRECLVYVRTTKGQWG